MSNGDAQPALLNAFLLSTKDALMVFEAARRGICPVVTRRLQDGEKSKMIVSGSVFAFDEQSTGIKRWTDGALWSPSRIIGNYLIYRELDKKGEKEAARPPTQSGPSSLATSPHGQPSDPFDAKEPQQSSGPDVNEGRPSTSIVTGSTGLQRDLERALVGSLTTSYRFKKDGLIKKTISNGHLHLISYYTIDDVLAGRLRTPSSLIELASLEISPALLEAKNFRMPPVTERDMDGNLRYIGEEADPMAGPPILAPLLAPGSVPVARPLSAVADNPYGIPVPALASYEANDSHPFAFKPLDDSVYQAAPSESEAREAHYQHSHQQYHQRRPDTAQPLWSHQYQADEAQPATGPVAGPSGWRDRPAQPYVHVDVQAPSPLLTYQQHTQHQMHPQPYQPQPYPYEPDGQLRPLLQRSHSGAASHPEQPYFANGNRPMTQFRRQSYRPPTSNYPYPSRPSDPYPRPAAVRPATSPAPIPGMYSTPSSFANSRGSTSAKIEPDSPAMQHQHHPHYRTSGQQQQFPEGPPYNHYGPQLPSSHQPQPYLPLQPHPPSYGTISDPVAHSAPARTNPAFPYHDSRSLDHHEGDPLTSGPSQYTGPYQQVHTAPPYTDNFQQRSSHMGPVRPRFGPKIEDPS